MMVGCMVFAVMMCGVCRAGESNSGDGYGYVQRPLLLDSCSIGRFLPDPSDTVPHITPDSLSPYTYDDSITLTWDSLPRRHYPHYRHFAIVVQRAAGSDFKHIEECILLEEDSLAHGYDSLPCRVTFTALERGRTYYYRAVALADSVYDGDTIPVRANDHNGHDPYAYVFSTQGQPDTAEGPHCFPNPFNPSFQSTIIVVGNRATEAKEIRIYDTFGNLVRSGIERQRVAPGAYSWDGKNGEGMVVGNGGYMCVIDVGADGPLYVKIAVRK